VKVASAGDLPLTVEGIILSPAERTKKLPGGEGRKIQSGDFIVLEAVA